jgi:hypothetical protein
MNLNVHLFKQINSRFDRLGLSISLKHFLLHVYTISDF